MIIGSSKLDINKIKSYIDNPSGIVAYSDSLVPIWARHIMPIVMNQRYYIAVQLRGSGSLSFKQKAPLLEELLKGCYITGDLIEFTDIHDLLHACNKETLTVLIKAGVNNEPTALPRRDRSSEPQNVSW